MDDELLHSAHVEFLYDRVLELMDLVDQVTEINDRKKLSEPP